MVKIEETTDEFFQNAQAAEDADEWQDDDESEFSDEDEDLDRAVNEETFLERIYALRDIVPPSTRQSIVNTFSTASDYAFAGGSLVGKIAWVVTTSALLVGLPFALAVEDEARYAQQEREFQAQQSGASMLGAAPGAPGQPGQPQAGGQPPQGLRPPGF